MAARAVPVVAVAPASAPTASTAAAPARANVFGRELRERSHDRTDAWSHSFPGLPRRRTAASSRWTPPPNSTWCLVPVVPIRSPYRAGGTQSGSVLVALTIAVALEGADLSVGLQRGFGGRRCSRFRSAVKGPDLLRPAWIPNRFDRRSPRILVDRPARADPAVTVDEPRCALTPTRLGASRRAGPRSLSHPPKMPLTWGAAAEQRLTRGQCAPHRPMRRSPPRPWTRTSACGTPLPPLRTGRTISSKRLRGTDSIPVFPQRVRRGTRDGPGSPTPLPAYSWCSSVLVLRHFGAAARHFGAGAQGRARLSMGGTRNGRFCLVVAARNQLPGS